MSLVTNLDHIFKKGVIGLVRKAQEDSHDMKLKTPNGDVFVVCDGMGGHVGGATASDLAVKNIIEYLNSEKYEDPIAALDNALKRANDQILGFAAEHPEFKGMGTTACILLLQSDCAYLAHVGDSRIYLYDGKEQKLHRVTKDHSYVQTLVDAGQISDEEAEHHPNKNRILKALGVVPSSSLQPSFNQGHPRNGDIFLICSDGLSGMIPDRTIERVLQQNSSLEARGEMLINLAMEGETVHPGGQDNCTLELIQIDNSAWTDTDERAFQLYDPKTTQGKQKHKGPNKSQNKRKKIGLRIVIGASIAVGLLLILSAGGWWTCKNHYEKRCIELRDSLESAIKDTNSWHQKLEDLNNTNTSSYNQDQVNNHENMVKNAERQLSNKRTNYNNANSLYKNFEVPFFGKCNQQ